MGASSSAPTQPGVDFSNKSNMVQQPDVSFGGNPGQMTDFSQMGQPQFGMNNSVDMAGSSIGGGPVPTTPAAQSSAGFVDPPPQNDFMSSLKSKDWKSISKDLAKLQSTKSDNMTPVKTQAPGAAPSQLPNIYAPMMGGQQAPSGAMAAIQGSLVQQPMGIMGKI